MSIFHHKARILPLCVFVLFVNFVFYRKRAVFSPQSLSDSVEACLRDSIEAWHKVKAQITQSQRFTLLCLCLLCELCVLPSECWFFSPQSLCDSVEACLCDSVEACHKVKAAFTIQCIKLFVYIFSFYKQ